MDDIHEGDEIFMQKRCTHIQRDGALRGNVGRRRKLNRFMTHSSRGSLISLTPHFRKVLDFGSIESVCCADDVGGRGGGTLGGLGLQEKGF